MTIQRRIIIVSAINFSRICNQSFIGKLLRLPLKLIPREFLISITQGKKWIVGSGNHGCCLGIYEHDMQSFFESIIFLSAHSKEIHQECCELLSSLGYKLQSIGDQRLEESDEILAVY